MRILIVSTSVIPLGESGYGGIEKLCYDFVEQLNNRGHRVSVAAPIGSIVPNGVQLLPTVKLPEEQDRDDLAFERMGAVRDFDIIHDFSHGHQIGQHTANIFDIPLVSMLWDPITHRYDKAPYNIVCLSEWQKERFERLYNRKAIVMPPLVNTDRYKPDPNAKRERFLFLGKISPEKGVHLAIDYAKELKVPLDVVGGLIPSEQNSPYLRQILTLRDDCVAKGYDIRFHWNVNEEDKINFLQNAKAVIYPVQQDEAHWLVGVESQCCGTPTITYMRGSFEDYFCPHTTDNDIEFKNIMCIIDKLELMNPIIRKIAIERWGHESVIPLYEKLYEDVASGRRWI